jgi:hypothetical protein
MSIVGLMQDAAEDATRPDGDRSGTTVRRGPRVQPAQRSTPAAIGAELARYVPTEAVTLYTAILPFLVSEDTPLADQDYTSRWVLAIGVGIFAVLYAVGVYRREITARKAPFKVPPKRTAVVAFAYAAWVFVLPGSPFNDFGWYTPTIGAIGGLVAAALIALGILWFGEPEAATP